MEFVTKRIYEPASGDDGFRMLVDRLWPRGVSREKAMIDLWAKELAPSHSLRKWFAHTPKRYTEFAHLYRQELDGLQDGATSIISAAREHKRTTLLYAAKETQHNHAIVLRDWLETVDVQVRSLNDVASKKR